VLVAVAVLLFARIVWDVPTGVLVQGALIGGLSSLLALGLALVWRANRVINFSAGDLGAVPATLAVLLAISTVGLGWWPALGVGLAVAIGIGVVVERVVVRRFFTAPRLVLSVATIGIAELLAAGALLLPRAFDLSGDPIPAPFDASITIDPITFGGADVMALVAIPFVFVALAVFFRRTDLGIAIRAGAERADRAVTLGIPVRRLETVVWVLATVLAFLAVYLRAGIVGLPLGVVLGPAILLRALAAAVIGGMERLATIAFAAIVLGVVEQAVVWHWREPAYVDPVLFVVVLVALLVARRPSRTRAGDASTWRAAREVRPIPAALRRVREIRIARWVLPALVVLALVAVPAVLTERQVNLAGAILIFAIIGLSLVVLTGWVGQVSLGQMAFVGIGAAVGGTVTARLGWDLSLALVLGGLVGAATATIIGLPALRRRGLTLAVTSLAFALATSSWLLNRSYFGEGTTFDWLPPDRIGRPDLFGIVSVRGETSYYFLCLAGLGVAYAMVWALRRSRTGRVLVAVRENDRAAEAFGVHARRVTLAGFAFSGFLAAFAGVLFVHHQEGLAAGPYSPTESLEVFAMTVIGGLGSAAGALLGATYVRGVDYYLPVEWQILATGAGLLLVLLVFPGGLGGAIADLREAVFRRVARRRSIAVPSLLRTATSTDRETVVAEDAAAPRGAGPGGAPLLEVRALDVRRDGVQILFGVHFSAAPGEVVALLGTNGAGKSTLLRAVAGLSDIAAGSITIDGHDTTHTAPERLAALGVASVPGGQGTFPSLTVREHLRLAGWTRRDAADLDAATDAVLTRLPLLRDRLDDAAGDLSGGQQQFLNLAMAVVAEPRILLLDELSLGLASTATADLFGLVRDLAADGTTVVVVEQSVGVALEIAARAYFLEKGEVRYEGPTADLLERPDLVRSVFLGSGTRSVAIAARTARPTREQPADQTAHLEVTAVAAHFGGVVALDQVSFSTRPGEVLGVIGPNGAGKTTLFDVVGGFLPAGGGSVVLRDADGARDLARRSPAQRAQLGLGRSFQDSRLFPALTVAETIAVALEDSVEVRDPIAAAVYLPAVSASETAVAAEVDRLLELVGLEGERDAFVHELSTGTRRLVDLACAVAHRPRILLLDEPTSGIAQSEAAALAPLLLQVRDELHATLVVIEHDLTFLHSIADRLLALDLGRVVAEGEPGAVLADPAVVAAYLGTTRRSVAP
jgi:ABC-type branched-subunit amino acid transport system ATPase component/ABC-type branched-subunit amino acid transport system permease subunit